MANIGLTLPATASSFLETGWNDPAGNWDTPQGIYGPGSASITNNSWDQNDPSWVLRGQQFNFSAIPAGSTINGIECRIVARATSTATYIGLVQLLDTTGTRVGTNSGSAAVTLTTAAAPYSFGGPTNLWGNVLTDVWVKNSSFGVGIGMINGANNGDVFVDTVELDVYYTEVTITKIIKIVNDSFMR